jgi:hypothetical protein
VSGLPIVDAPTLPVLGFDRATAGPGTVSIDLQKLISTRLLLSATSGGGKSWALRALLEGTFGRVQQVVLDWEGEFASLRERFAYVLAGTGGDVPARPETAAALTRRLLELSASAIVDLSDLGVPDRQAFVAAFVGELMAVPRALWRPLLIAIDEAQWVCPETGQGEAVSKAAVLSLCSQGRKRGFCPVLATQRIAGVSNFALAELLNVMTGPTSYEPDVKRAGDGLGFGRADRERLKDLDAGQFFVRGPAISRRVQLVRTGPVLTSHPEPGQIAPPAPPAPEAIRALLGQLADLPAAPAPAEGPTPATIGELEALRARNAELEHDLHILDSSLASAEEYSHQLLAERDALREQLGTLRDGQKLRNLAGVARAISSDADKLREMLDSSAARLAAPASDVDAHHDVMLTLTDEPAILPTAGSEGAGQRNGLGVPSVPSPELRSASQEETGGSPAPVSFATPSWRRVGADAGSADSPVREAPTGSPAEQRILDALATLAALGEQTPSRAAVAGVSGYRQSGTWNSAVSRLEKTGRLAFPEPGALALTDAGRRLARRQEIRTLDGLHECWRGLLNPLQRKLFDAVIAVHPGSIDRATLAERLGYQQSGTFNSAVSYLRTLGCVVYPKPDYVAPSALLFPAGLTS